MPEKQFDKIIASLNIQADEPKHKQIVNTIHVRDHKNIENRLVKVNKGTIVLRTASDQITLKSGDMFFLPEGTPFQLLMVKNQIERSAIISLQVIKSNMQKPSPLKKYQKVPH